LLIEPSTLGRLGDVDLGSAVAAFREVGVPVVLFARVAEHVDLALVADVDVVMVEDPVVAGLARSRVGDDRVFGVLPSVDAAVFNPVDWQRDPAGGVGLFVSYPPRELDLSGERWLFDACGSDLDVFVSSSSALPAWLQGRVRGALEGLGEVAKQYRVAVESPLLHRSEAEFVRRVLQLVAVGTPVVTTGSALLAEVSDSVDSELVVVVSSPDEAAEALDGFLSDSLYRERFSVGARREVLGLHTHRQRFEELLGRLDAPVLPPERVSIVFSTNRPGYLEHAYGNIRSQDWVDKELITVLHGDGFDLGVVERLNATLDFPVTVVEAPQHWTLGDCYNAAIDAATGDYITIMDDDDYYGEHHITDLVLAHRYSNADIVGKMVDYFYLADLEVTVARDTGATERFTKHVGGATMLLSRDLARLLRFERISLGVDKSFYGRALWRGRTIYSTHPFNINVNRRSSGHTWQLDYDDLLGIARETYRGTADEVFRV
jgi:glycosyltransferase involved in cell wall biosynthesis